MYAYDGPCDIDLGVGGMMHSSEDGDILSDVFDRIFASQFKNLKCGDPFFFSNALEPGNLSWKFNISFLSVLGFRWPHTPFCIRLNPNY